MALSLDIGTNDMLLLGDTYITLEHKSGGRARLKIVGPAEARLIKNARNSEAARADLADAAKAQAERQG